MKKCNKCLEFRSLSDFYKDKSKKDGLKTTCIVCRKSHYSDNKESINEKERNRYSIYSKEENYKSRKKKYYQDNKEVLNKRSKKWRDENLDRHKELSKINYTKNKAGILAKYKDRLDNDPLFKFIQNIKCNIRNSLVRTGYSKRTKTFEILCIEFIQFREYIENQFQEGMTWDNYGDWHLDHKTPISWARTEEEAVSLCHYTNYQPLWLVENISKSNKYKSE